MSRPLPLLGKSALLALLLAGLAGCESSDNGHPKKKVVTAEQFDASRGDNLSGLPWNRPRAFESGSGMGRMMPQTR